MNSHLSKETIRSCCVGALIVLTVFYSTPVMAVEFFAQPRLEAGIMYYSFESEAFSVTSESQHMPANFTQESFEYGDNMPFVGTGLTFFLGRCFLDVSGQWAFDGEDGERVSYSAFALSVNNNFAGYTSSDPVHDASFDRTEFAASIGYAFNERFSLFVGYKQATTEFATTFRGSHSFKSDTFDNAYQGPSGGNVWGKDEFSFEHRGPFIGAIYGWEFGDNRFFKGMLTVTLAVAYLEGEVELNRKESSMNITWIDDRVYPGDIVLSSGKSSIANRYDTSGDSIGLTFGFGWRGSTGVKGLSYAIGVSGYRYEFEADEQDKSEINETVVTYKGGLSFAF